MADLIGIQEPGDGDDSDASRAASVCIVDSGAGIGSTTERKARLYCVKGTREKNTTVVTTAATAGAAAPPARRIATHRIHLDR